jgi:CubicO group peptidase (beta-lactamase class C family)
VITTRDLLSHLSGIRHYFKKGVKEEDEMSNAEYFFKDKFDSVEKSMELFQNDELLHAPGSFPRCMKTIF